MRLDGFRVWFLALSVSTFALNVVLNYCSVGTGGWGLPFAFLRWTSAPPPLATHDFRELALAADVAAISVAAWLCSRWTRAQRQ